MVKRSWVQSLLPPNFLREPVVLNIVWCNSIQNTNHSFGALVGTKMGEFIVKAYLPPEPTTNTYYLKPDDRFRIPVDDLEREVDADGGAVVLREELVHVALDERRLSGSGLTDHQNLVQELVLG